MNTSYNGQHFGEKTLGSEQEVQELRSLLVFWILTVKTPVHIARIAINSSHLERFPSKLMILYLRTCERALFPNKVLSVIGCDSGPFFSSLLIISLWLIENYICSGTNKYDVLSSLTHLNFLCWWVQKKSQQETFPHLLRYNFYFNFTDLKSQHILPLNFCVIFGKVRMYM